MKTSAAITNVNSTANSTVTCPRRFPFILVTSSIASRRPAPLKRLLECLNPRHPLRVATQDPGIGRGHTRTRGARRVRTGDDRHPRGTVCVRLRLNALRDTVAHVV